MLLLFLVFSKSEVAQFCVYTKHKSNCDGFPEDVIYPDSTFSKNLSSLSKKTSQFDNYDKVEINIAEDLSKSDIDLFLLKNAHHIYLQGIVNPPPSFELNVKDVTTLENLTIKHCMCVKDSSTEFFMENLTLSEVQWSRFDKASMFYGGILESDLLSIRSCAFRFDSVIYHVNYTEKFTPQTNISFAVFTANVEFRDFLDGASLFQYGNQFIVTPVSKKNGFFRTNFRSTTDANISYKISHNIPGSTLYIGSWFSNREAVLSDAYLYTQDNSVNIGGFKWNRFERINIQTINSTIVLNETQAQVTILDGSESSQFEILGNYSFKRLNSKSFNNINFKASILNIDDLAVTGDDHVDIQAEYLNINTLSAENLSTTSFNDFRITIHNISPLVSSISCGTFVLPEDLLINYKDFVPCITAKKVESGDTRTIVELVHIGENNSFTTDFIPIITSPDISGATITPYIKETVFPILSSVQDNSYGFLVSNFNNHRISQFCVSDDGESTCSQSEIIKSKSNNLNEMISSTELPSDYFFMANIKVFLDTESKFTVASPSNFEEISVFGLKPNSNVYIQTPSVISTSSYTNLSVSINNEKENPEINSISLYNCTIDDFIASKLSFDNIYSFSTDATTYSLFSHPLEPKRLNINSPTIVFDANTIKPNLPVDQDISARTRIEIRGVNTISGSGAFKSELKVIVVPEKEIHFTTNTYGNLSFIIYSSIETDIYYKANLPADLYDSGPNTKYHLHPNFLGIEITSSSRFCTNYLDIDLAPDQNIIFSQNNLLCNKKAKIGIPTEIAMFKAYVAGVLDIPKLTIRRQLYMDPDTYLRATEFSNPDDDFLLYFNWSLNKMPYFRIDNYMAENITSYLPTIETYVYPSDDDDYIKENSDIFSLGIPYLCILASEFKGNIFREGLVFHVDNETSNVATVFKKVGLQSDADICAYVIPYEDGVVPDHSKGPKNPTPFIIMIVISFLMVIFIVVAYVYSMYFKHRKRAKKDLVIASNENSIQEVLSNDSTYV